MVRRLWLLVAVALTACAAPPTPRPTATPFTGVARPVLIDSDLAPDDWLAILYLLRRPEVDVQAITVTGTGEAHCEPGLRLARGLTALAGRPDLPVACGRETPLRGEHTFPAEWRERVDAGLGLTLPENPAPAPASSAVALLTDRLRAAPGQVTVLTLGPLTNLAEALQAAPDLAGRIAMVYSMGGAVDEPGNVGASGAGLENPFAEWNIYVDPHAANLVLQSGAPVTLVPLDATRYAPITLDFYRRLERDRATPEAEFVYAVLTEQKSFIEAGGYFFWDPLAAAILVDESLAAFDRRPLGVTEAEGPDSGRLGPAAAGPALRFAVRADGPRFEQAFLDALNAGRP
ncbi:MAG: nucleoside hydrolase [Anaerolineales bacterium]|nr:nucleoside hydrolase [Anaerolineales bacterium]